MNTLSGNAQSANFDAEVFEKDTSRSHLLFRIHRAGDKIDGFTADGKPAFHEEIQSSHGLLTSYMLQQFQAETVGKLVSNGDLKNPKLEFTQTVGRKVKSDSEEPGVADGPVVIAPNLQDEIRTHWDALMKGESVEILLPVLERLETIGFKLAKKEETQVDGKLAVVIELKPTSFFVSLAVSPSAFYFDKENHKLLLYKGHSLMKVFRDGKWQDLEAEIVYHE